MLLILYLLIGATASGVNYYVRHDKEYTWISEEFDCVLGSIVICVFWPICVGIVAARMYEYIQKHK